MVSCARRAAFEVLRRVEMEAGYASDLLQAQLPERSKREDAALATELTLGVLRWQRLLDWLLEQQMKKPVAHLDGEVRVALRLGLYQLRFLSRIPARAAVHESVELVKWARKRSAAALVNAILRRAPREPAEELVPRELAPAERLGVLYSHPTWLVERWLARLGAPRTIALLEANNRPPRLAGALHGAAPRAQVVSALERAGLRVTPGRWLRSAVAVTGGNPRRTSAFRRGWISIQDEASQLIPLLLDVRAGHSVLDVCAAPGGKTAALARAAGRSALVVAADRHVHRLSAAGKQLARLGITHVQLVALDATRPLPFARPFERVLLDVPCSGTGTLARNPEIRWRLRPGDLPDFQRRQTAMLEHALAALAPRSRLVYSTCSLEPEENEGVVAAVLARHPEMRRADARALLQPYLIDPAAVDRFFDQDGVFRTFSPEHATDSFFAVLLEKVRERA